ncbi:MAG TPA: glycogen/starch/alpha-glucan phosphorylase, partial [Bacillota bacterium]|nr:glycogen/starch/alpha-glucan phosphorylase [Bacillota bacterium]
YFVLADFRAYASAHERVDRTYKNPELWWDKAIVNIANAGMFSSDRTVLEYNDKIWHVPKVK